MRYQDWDVLLFPHAAHVPIPEFRTDCVIVQDQHASIPTVVTHIPSLPAGAPFSISIHSWTPPQLGKNITLDPQQPPVDCNAIQVRVVIDGVLVSTVVYHEKSSWPLRIISSDLVDAYGQRKALSFPAFNNAILAQRQFSVNNEDLGRIHVYVSQVVVASHLDGRKKRNLKLSAIYPIASFLFQPAPREILERTGISWPNHKTPIVQSSPTACSKAALPAGLKSQATADGRRDSGIVVSPATQGHHPMMLPTLDTRVVGPQTFRDNNSQLSSRTTSSSSTSSSTTPTLATQAFKGHAQGVFAKIPGLSSMRLPEDQLNKILAAIKSLETKDPADEQTNSSDHASSAVIGHPVMPTPPRHSNTPPVPVPAPAPVRSNENRTPTDVTMHMACNSFPDCTVEDPVGGGLVHRSPTKTSPRTETPKAPSSDSGDSVVVVKTIRRDLAIDTSVATVPGLKRQKRARSSGGSEGPSPRGASDGDEPKRKVSKTGAVKVDDNSFGVH